jgi:dTDP-4-dehydrorhamnose reductase
MFVNNEERILITGASGRLGRELSKIYRSAFTPTREEMDITDESSVSNYISKIRPNLIFHTAALTNVRTCEENKELCWNTNVKGTEYLVKYSIKEVPDCYFIFISTAGVFYGDKGNYSEADLPYPINFYSLSKLLGEYIIQGLHKEHSLLIRTNFVTRQPWPYEKAFVDRWGTYLFSEDLASAIKEIAVNKLSGVIHLGGDKKTSMYELAKLISPDVKPMSMNDYQGPPLTRDMSLKSIRIKQFKLNI